MSARAELIADGGAAAAGGDFFRSPGFFAAEGVTHTLRIEADPRDLLKRPAAPAELGRQPGTISTNGGPVVLLAPLVVRPIGDGPERDAVSPYGYPGVVPATERERSHWTAADAFATPPPAALDPAEIDFSATGLVSVFLRHRLGPPPLAGSTARNLVQVADPALPPKSRPSDRRQIRRNADAGYEIRGLHGRDSDRAERAAFRDLYEQTMRRTGADPHYLFDAEYFDRLFAVRGTWLFIAREPGGDPAAASLVTTSDGFLHYYLSGSADAHLRDSPMKSLLSLLLDLSQQLELPLNLGGGIARGDALEEFKRGFANRSLEWRTSEIVCDRERYAALSAGREAGEYFPAYRAPA